MSHQQCNPPSNVLLDIRPMELDNPVWYALSETHSRNANEFGNIKFYDPAYCPFGAFENEKGIADGIDQYSKLCNNFFVVGNRPKFSNHIKLLNELVCNQMLVDQKIDLISNEKIVELGDDHSRELFDLVNLVQPGYFRQKTHTLGDYFGIFQQNKLVAVTGERMKMNEYTEVSAVVTHPDFLGRGYAKQLVAHVVNRIFDQGKLPFLHVAESNVGAIVLYEKLGFRTRGKISFWKLGVN